MTEAEKQKEQAEWRRDIYKLAKKYLKIFGAGRVDNKEQV